MHAGFLWLRGWGYCLVSMCGILVAVASLVAELGLQARGFRQLQHADSSGGA